jgi:acetolactate synthase-1/2/3 large subunit
VLVYETINKGLKSVGVEAVFGGAGKNAAHLLSAPKSTSRRIRGIVARHAQAGSSMASGYSMCTQKLDVYLAMRDGALNLFCGLAAASSHFDPRRPSSGVRR